MIYYTLRDKKTKRYLTLSSSSNAARDFCGECSYTLDGFTDDIMQAWKTTDDYKAEFVRNFPTPWYNSSEETPDHDYDADDLEVIEFQVKVEINETPATPLSLSPEEFFKLYYGLIGVEPNARHLNMLLDNIKDGLTVKYSLYDLERLINHLARVRK